MNKIIDKRIAAIDYFLSLNGFRSFDPYDGLKSPIGWHLLRNSQLLLRVWQQFVRLFPINLRPILGIKKIEHTKAVSDFASAYSILFAKTRNEKYKQKAVELFDTLERIGSPTPNGLGWGLRFPFATRFVKADATQPNIFQTINAINSFLDGYDAFKNPHYIEIAKKGFTFLKDDLGFIESDDTIYWRYWTGLSVEIFNVSGLMIGLCARMGAVTGNREYTTYSQKLFNYIKKAQNLDGSWYYSADSKGWFIDGFHTGYILEGICRGILEGAIQKDSTLERGIDYYLGHFFTKEGIPRYYYNSTYPIDGQNTAQALQTLYFILNANFAVQDLITQSFERIDDLLWNKKGYYNYKKSKLLMYTTPMHRWVTGPMLLALSYLKTST